MSSQANPITTNAPEHPSARTDRRTHSSRQVAAMAGAASVLVGVAGLTIAETNTAGVDPGSTAPFVVEILTERTGDLRAGAILAAAAATLAMVFLGPLWFRLKQSGEWQAMIAVAGCLTLALFWLSAAAQQVAFLTFAQYSDGEAARTLVTLGWDTWRYLAFPFMIMALAAALTALPVWFRVVSLLVVAVEAVALIPGIDAWAPVMLGCSWTITASVLAALSPDPGRPAEG